MEKSRVNLWLSLNAENFSPERLEFVRTTLEELPEDKLMYLQSGSFQKPSIILLIAVFLGWERFWLDDFTLGVIKILTGYGCGVWWLIDIFSAKTRAQEYNFQQFTKLTSL